MSRSFSLHRTFLGPPGVSKTTAAKLYRQLILDLGLTSGKKPPAPRKREEPTIHEAPIVVNPSDLIGAYIGHSEEQTKEYLSSAMGGVLITDEAHMLYTSRANGENSTDVFRRGVIDTIVAEVTADSDEDRCIILLGYPDAMEDMLLHGNPGLQRRFPKETSIKIDSYSADQLFDIFTAKMNAEHVQATDVALEVVKQI